MSNQKVSSHKHSKVPFWGDKRIPLSAVFLSSIATIIFLFFLVSVLAFSRLQNFSAIITQLTEESVPKLAISGRIVGKVNQLTYLTEGLTRAQNEVVRRVLFTQLQSQISDIQLLALDPNADPALQAHIQGLDLEINELNQLVKSRLDIESAIQDKLKSIYQLYNQVMIVQTDQPMSNRIIDDTNWKIIFADIVAMSSRVATLERLTEIRQIERGLKEQINKLAMLVQGLPDNQRNDATTQMQLLKKLVIDKSGLVEQKITHLRTKGRTTGRGNFVRNFILDYAGMSEYRAYQLNEATLERTKDTTEQVKRQVSVLTTISVIAILILLGVLYLIQSRIVNRLEKLNSFVRDRLAGRDTPLSITGNDEISDIAKSFEKFALTIEKQKQILEEISLSDGLTGIANRRAFDNRIEHDIKLAIRHQWPLTVILFDVDHFKLYNDSYGHAVGDECLKDLATSVKKVMRRDQDFFARYGGEEFVCILANTNFKGAKAVSDTILQTVRNQAIPHQKSPITDYVTVSVGSVTATPSQEQNISPIQLLKQADQALYEAKEQGRNRKVNMRLQ
ncbi:diguanylate cyclase [Alteromonas ponticola]|uniref:diguanylate cyclase n=1 Tax=Alteromonas aquimaris TaxID=2998417 RepID=A0ABT3P8J7_9ALTE|nr:diguanylate cyclase [Alteromonas aquimaris]MCW8109101.1 diguanylate cyclase [Alteromonas aquimaris]